MEIWIALAGFGIGALLMIRGGDCFVQAAVWIAEAFGIPKFVVGATVVSLATTLPEIMVSLMAAAEGWNDMAVGNAVGSVSANTGLILALCLLFMPVPVSRRDLGSKGAVLVLSCLSLWLLSYGGLTAAESLVQALLLAAFLADNLLAARRSALPQTGSVRPRTGAGRQLLLFLLGAAMLAAGSRLLVVSGTDLARMLGVPDRVIAVTMVAIGTSLPELVTAVTAILKRQGALSVGNILGANILDITLILPLCALLSHGMLPVSGASLALDLPVCFLESVLAVVPTLVRRRFSRVQGAAMVTVYLAYLLATVG